MTDAKLATLRDGCQRGVMPTDYRFHDIVAAADILGQRKYDLLSSYVPDKHRYLDALAALQEALNPGSHVSIEYRRRADGRDEYRATLWTPVHDDMWPSIKGEHCPTLATAWLDAILAGLQQEKDDG